MTPRTTRLIAATSSALLLAPLLAGCGLVSIRDGGGAPARPAASAEPSETPAGDPGPSQADPEIVVLDDDDVTDLPQFTRSTPAGTWPVGEGLPEGFPAGIPAYPDRWVKGNTFEFDSDGKRGYSAMFWGDYAAVDALLVRFRELGFEVDDRQDDTKRVIVLDTERYRVIINATESAVDPQTEELLDPSYTYSIVFQQERAGG